MGCTENPCPITTFIQYSTPVNDIIGYYTCASACQKPGYMFYVGEVEGTPIYRCGDCNRQCQTCISRDECLSCSAGHFQSGVQYECLPCNTLWGSDCESCTSSQCLTCLASTFIDTRVSSGNFKNIQPLLDSVYFAVAYKTARHAFMFSLPDASNVSLVLIWTTLHVKIM